MISPISTSTRAATLPMVAGANAGAVGPLGGGINSTWLLVGAGAVVGCVLPIPGGPLGGAILGYLIARFM